MKQDIVRGKTGKPASRYLSDLSKSDYSGERILLVEDNEFNSEIAKEIIGMTGAVAVSYTHLTLPTMSCV